MPIPLFKIKNKMPALNTPAAYKSGDRYERLTLTGKGYLHGNGRMYIEVICDCGKIYFTRFDSVINSKAKSCGCLRREEILKSITKHGLANDKCPIYKAWSRIKQKCTNSKNPSFKDYGARGISVCDEWATDYTSFYEWSIVNGWAKGLSLDRINNDGNYEPSNCRWTTVAVQNRNKRTTRLITAFEETKCFADWVLDSRCVVPHATLYYRLSSGKWSTENAITILPDTIKNRSKDAILNN